MNQLKVVKIGNKKYFLDARLKELRNIKNPNDYIELSELEVCLFI
jgi:hypothetical protein